MNRSKRLLTAACAAAFLAPAGAALAGDAAAQAGQQPAAATAQTDDQLATRIEKQLHAQPGLEDVKAESDKGVVTLKGQVASAMQKDRAEQIARTTMGVTRVQNEIEIQS